MSPKQKSLEGNILKMRSSPGKPVKYWFRFKDSEEAANQYIGKNIRLEYLDCINCIHCGRKTKKSFHQGYCYPCFISLAETDTCIVRPHTCHFDAGTCRDEAFAKTHCFIPHILYLAQTSGLKVGITRKEQTLTRWVDQGAVQALPVAELVSRKEAGDLEVHLAQSLADKTNWRKMLKNEIDKVDLKKEADNIIKKIPAEYKKRVLKKWDVNKFEYQVQQYPLKVKSVGFDKVPVVEGRLTGIKGQYLYFGDEVINMRKHQGYKIKMTFS